MGEIYGHRMMRTVFGLLCVLFCFVAASDKSNPTTGPPQDCLLARIPPPVKLNVSGNYWESLGLRQLNALFPHPEARFNAVPPFAPTVLQQGMRRLFVAELRQFLGLERRDGRDQLLDSSCQPSATEEAIISRLAQSLDDYVRDERNLYEPEEYEKLVDAWREQFPPLERYFRACFHNEIKKERLSDEPLPTATRLHNLFKGCAPHRTNCDLPNVHIAAYAQLASVAVEATRDEECFLN